jgi:hypothetical protein
MRGLSLQYEYELAFLGRPAGRPVSALLRERAVAGRRAASASQHRIPGPAGQALSPPSISSTSASCCARGPGWALRDWGGHGVPP